MYGPAGRMATRFSLPGLLLAAVLVSLPGCGGGGGAPPSVTTISGRVCDATDTSTPVAGAHVYVTPSTRQGLPTRQAILAEDETDADGNYTLRGTFTGEVEIHVEGTDGFSGIVIHIDVSGQGTISIQITLLPTGMSVSRIEIDPEGPLTLDPGQQQQFTATVYDGGSPIPDVTPTWAVSGNIGTIDDDGLFSAGSSHATGHVVAVVSNVADVEEVIVGIGAQTYDLSDYHPFHVGDKWVGRDVISGDHMAWQVLGTEDVSGIECFKLSRPGGGYWYWAWTDDGLLQPRYDSKYGSTLAVDPQTAFTLPRTLRVGETAVFPQLWEDHPWDEGPSYEEQVTRTVTLLAVEAVSVPAGTFPDCLKVHKTNDITYPGGTAHDDNIFWYAKNVGIVKARETHTETGQPQSTIEAEAVGIQVGGVVYGQVPPGYNLADYWPLQEGNEWSWDDKYEYLDAAVPIGRGLAYPKVMEDGDIDYLWGDDSGFYLMGEFDHGQSMVYVYEPPMEIPAGILPGETRSCHGDILVGGTPTDTYAFHVTLEGVENVTVPAGHFTGCLRVYIELSEGQASIWRDWYASGVGPVKEQNVATGVTRELMWAIVDGQQYGNVPGS